MFKFQFNRLDEPTKPTWNHDPTKTIYDAANAGLLQPIVKHVWSWMLGLVEVPKEVVADKEIATWKSSLDNRNGHIRLNAAYNLALCHKYDALIDRLYHTEEIFCFEAAYALTACRYSREAITRLHETLRKEKNSGQVAYCIAFILSEMGTPALDVLPSLVNIAQTRDAWLLQQYCCEALGNIQSDRQQDIDDVVRCLTAVLTQHDQSDHTKGRSHIRLTAALSLAKLGVKAVQATPSLKDALYLDENRYVNANALLALERIGTNEALRISLDYLKMARWCAKTTPASLF